MQIIADTATLLPPGEKKNDGLTIIPISVAINGHSYRDYSEISSAEFLEQIHQGGIPTSSQPAIGDLLEGMLHISEGYMQIYDSDGKVIECVPLTDSAITTSFSNAFVFCATNIFPDESGHVFADNQKPVFKEFGDTALVIENKGEFIKRIYKAAKELGYEVFYGVVNYYNKDEDNANMHISLLHGMHNIAFWKVRKDCCIDDSVYVIRTEKISAENRDFYAPYITNFNTEVYHCLLKTNE